MKRVSPIILALLLAGCGGSMSTVQTPPVVVPPVSPPSVTPPPTVPSSWQFTDLPPIPGTNAAQANAVNSRGDIVGYSVTSEGLARVTRWQDGAPVDLGPGVATGINDTGQISGYHSEDGFHAMATLDGADLGLLKGFDSTLATGVNASGVVVGVAYNSMDTGQQTAVEWINGSIQTVPGCQSALAINDKGQIAGIADNFNAAICGSVDYGVLGAAGAINASGQTVGYSNDHAFVFPDTDLGPQSLATGIDDYGWVIGESFTPLSAPAVRHTVLARLFNARLAGVSHPWIWSKDTGLMSLPGMVTANGINGKRIVGATVTGDGFIHGLLLTGD